MQLAHTLFLFLIRAWRVDNDYLRSLNYRRHELNNCLLVDFIGNAFIDVFFSFFLIVFVLCLCFDKIFFLV